MRGSHRYLVLVLLAVLVVTAGCTSSTGSETDGPPSTTVDRQVTVTTAATDETVTTVTTDENTIPEQDTTTPDSSETTTATVTPEPTEPSELRERWGIDASRSFQRVEQLLGMEAAEPSVTVSAAKIEDVESTGYSADRNLLLVAFGLNETDAGAFELGGYTQSEAEIVLSPNLSRTRAESAFVHESAHAVQQQSPGTWTPSTDDGLLWEHYPAGGQEYHLLAGSLREGSAEYVEVTYRLQYLADETNATSTSEALDEYESWYANQSGAVQYFEAPYVYGLSYVASQAQDPSGITDVFDAAPTTTEQLLHGYTPEEEPATALSLSVAGDASLSEYGRYSPQGTNGELFTRMALDQELDRERAIEAAAGWGNDTLVWAAPENGPAGHVWVTRWDSPADADQFESAISDYAEQRPDAVTVGQNTFETRFRTERASADTVVVYIGPQALAGELDVGISGSDVVIDPRE